MGTLEFTAFLISSILRLAIAGWALGTLYFDGIEKGIVTMAQVLLIYLLAELAITAAHNYVRYRAVLAQHKLRRAEKAAAERARQEARLQFMQAQHQASEKYFDTKDMVLGRTSKA